MQELMLLTDGSVNTQSKIGYGAYLAVLDPELSVDQLKTQVKVKRFAQTSSTKLELQTLLWALDELQPSDCKLIVYTDSQNIIGLPARRQRLEQNDYRSKKNIRLKNYALYQQFYRLSDQLNCNFVKLAGHLPADQKTPTDHLFTLVDRASRQALREDNQAESSTE